MVKIFCIYNQKLETNKRFLGFTVSSRSLNPPLTPHFEKKTSAKRKGRTDVVESISFSQNASFSCEYENLTSSDFNEVLHCFVESVNNVESQMLLRMLITLLKFYHGEISTSEKRIDGTTRMSRLQNLRKSIEPYQIFSRRSTRKSDDDSYLVMDDIIQSPWMLRDNLVRSSSEMTLLGLGCNAGGPLAFPRDSSDDFFYNVHN